VTLRVLVTGATGFVGRPLVERLVGAGHQVAAVANDHPERSPGATEFHVDVRDRAAIAGAIASFAPDRIVHLAALSHVGESWRRISDYFSVNVLGAEHVFTAAKAAKVPLLFMSSAEVYGLVPDEEQPIRESREPAPRTPYALTKAAAERLALAAGATVVRSFNLIGAGQAPTFALPDFARQLAVIERAAEHGAPGSRQQPAVLKVGNLSARRDFIPVREAVEGLLLLIESPAPGEIFNLASGESPSIAEMLERLIAATGLAVEIEEDAARLRPVDIERLCGDGSRLAARGWKARRDLDGALTDLWRAALAACSASPAPRMPAEDTATPAAQA
jgi:GDP-4-dehydro-6-deoxy-D-mannose reductase